MSSHFSLRWSYLVLVILAGSLSYFSFSHQDEWIGGLLSDTAAGIFGSLIIIFLIDKIIDGNNKKERLRMLRLVLSRLRRHIYLTTCLLSDMYIAASSDKPAILPSTFEDTFTENYFTEVTFLDYAKETETHIFVPVTRANPYGVRKLNWWELLNSTLSDTKKGIEKTIDMYAAYLTPELIEALEEIVSSRVMHNVSFWWRATRGRAPDDGYFRFANDLREFVSAMLKLLGLFNQYSSSPIEMKGYFEKRDHRWGNARRKV